MTKDKHELAGQIFGAFDVWKDAAPSFEVFDVFKAGYIAGITSAKTEQPNDTISRVTQEIAAILSEPQNRERIARRIESAEPTTVSD